MIALLLCFAVAPPVLDRRPAGPILDPLGMFSPAAIKDASAKIAELKKKFGHELMIETIDEQPAMQDVAGVLYRRVREERLRMWVRERARESRLEKGLYVVVTRHPPSVRLVGWPTDSEERFRWGQREDVRVGMQRYLHDNPDRALGEAVDRFGALLDQTRESPSPLATLGLLTVVGGLVGGWVVLCVVRRRVLGVSEPMYPPAVQGGVFGTPAASWIYDRLLHAEKGNPAPPAGPGV